MYVTRPLSQLLKSPESLAAPPEGPNSGYLVIQDEASLTYSWFGNKKRYLKEFPFPQDKELTVRNTAGIGDDARASHDPLFLIPVLNQPLSSSRYYAIVPHGKRKGEAFTCSREEDEEICCCGLSIKDVKPRPLDPRNIYQQFEIVAYEALFSSRGEFVANSIASDGFPPYFLRQKGWTICTKTPDNFKLDAAEGLNHKLRAHLPEFGFSISRKNSEPVVVGKWYTPFIFVKEGALRDQVKRSMYYELSLEQRWEQIFTCQKNTYQNQGNSVVIDASLEKEEVLLGGNKAMWNEKSAVNGVIWFTIYGPGGQQTGVGLRVELVQRMKWEQERAGWIGGEERLVKINKMEEFKEAGGWTEFGCYALVERFNLKRMDGSLVMSYDFKHFHHMKTKWE